MVQVADGGELAEVAGSADGGRFAARAEIAAVEEIGGGDYRGAEGAILVGALRPGEVAVQPEVKAHLFSIRPARRFLRRLAAAGGVSFAVHRRGSYAHFDALGRNTEIRGEPADGFAGEEAAVDLKRERL